MLWRGDSGRGVTSLAQLNVGSVVECRRLGQYWQYCDDFYSVIVRQFNRSLKKSQKFKVYVKYNIECHILVLENNLAISDL